ncbi:hypothetical protein MMC06_005524, partial [Schaereria dolodes]|nr:hypothetical protein [Schaereria dolodes]
MRPRPSTCLKIPLSHSPRHQTRLSSTSPPLITIRNIPAPHCGSILILSLNNPKSRNAISRALLADLSRHITDIHNEGPQGPTRALIIASDVDAAFCAGADLKERRGFTKEETAHFLTSLRHTFHRITTLPLPTLTALSSLALGGGLELALTTSLRVFASSAAVALPETRLAIIPGAGATYRLPALVGRARALDMILTGRRVGGREAGRWGLCDRVVDVGHVGDAEEEGAKSAREMVLGEAVGLAREICEGAPGAVRAAVRAVGGWAGEGREGKERAEDELENRMYEEVVGMEDRDEALR